MGTMIINIEDYFTLGCGRCDRFATSDCSTGRWIVGLNPLRRICLEAGLEETVKWAHPGYVHAGRNIVVMGAFREDFRLSFVNAALMKDRDGVLEKAGPNTRHKGVMRFTENAQVGEMEATITDYLKEAMGYAAAGIKPPKEERVLEMPKSSRKLSTRTRNWRRPSMRSL